MQCFPGLDYPQAHRRSKFCVYSKHPQFCDVRHAQLEQRLNVPVSSRVIYLRIKFAVPDPGILGKTSCFDYSNILFDAYMYNIHFLNTLNSH